MIINGKRYKLRKWVKIALLVLTLVILVALLKGAYNKLLNGPKSLEEALDSAAKLKVVEHYGRTTYTTWYFK